jgi:hypothetical protein
MSDDLNIGEGEAMIDSGSKKKPIYKLEELIVQCDTLAPISPELQEWERMPLVGREQT